MTTHDPVNHPSHYNQGPIECVEAMRSAFGDADVAIWAKIAAFKYLWRAGHKDHTDIDLAKAAWHAGKASALTKGAAHES